MKKIRVTVTIELNDDLDEIGRENIKNHIRDIIPVTGDKHPDDPLHMAFKRVRVGKIEPVTKLDKSWPNWGNRPDGFDGQGAAE